MINNQEVYNNESTVRDYIDHDYFPEPEKKILEIITGTHQLKKMLDIGVGAGRTTKYFAQHFNEYLGIDFSEKMIEACTKRFSGTSYLFKKGDATNLSFIEDKFYDFILFSFNGIDCVEIDKRLSALTEAYRVCKDGGWFAFSVHNIYNVDILYSFQTPRNPLKFLKEYKRMKMVIKLNPKKDEVLKNDMLSIIDGDLDFSTSYVYIKPEIQFKILEEIGFCEILMFDKNGKNVLIDDFINLKNQDPWIYFLCKKR